MDKSEECEIVWHNICGAFKIEDDGTNENIQHSNIGIFNHIILSNSINGIIIHMPLVSKIFICITAISDFC